MTQHPILDAALIAILAEHTRLEFISPKKLQQVIRAWEDWYRNDPSIPPGPLFHFDDQGQLIPGAHDGLVFLDQEIWGDCSQIFGVNQKLSGQGLRGDVSGLKGRIMFATGDATGLHGEIPKHGIDFDKIPMEERLAHPDIAYWVARFAQANPI